MVLANYIVLEPGIPKVLHFTSHYLGPRALVDPDSRHEKRLNVLEFQVDREDGVEVSKVLSITSEKLARELSPFLPDGAYLRMIFTITKSGAGYRTEYSVKVQTAV